MPLSEFLKNAIISDFCLKNILIIKLNFLFLRLIGIQNYNECGALSLYKSPDNNWLLMVLFSLK